MRITSILAILLIEMSLVFTACSSTESPTTPTQTQQTFTSTPESTQAQTQTPVTTLKPENQDDSYTIRVTGSGLVFNQIEADRLQAQRTEEYKQHLHEVLAMSPAEYEIYEAGGGDEKFNTELAEKYDKLYDNLYSDSPNIEFSGSYMVVTSNGGTSSRSVDGTTPAEYYLGSADIVSCAFQKTSESGSLKVEILKGGKMVNSSYTTADYGVVSVATD